MVKDYNSIRQRSVCFFIEYRIASNVGCSCKNGGRCLMGLGTYICECPYGYNGLSCETSQFG
jgi:hypothetical protein